MEQDNENLEKEKEAFNNQKTAHVAGKAAATYFGGAAGGKLYDAASKTKAGQALEKTLAKGIEKNPALNRTSQKLNQSGAMDAADKGLNMAGGGAAGVAGGLDAGSKLSEGIPVSSSKPVTSQQSSTNMKSSSGGNDSSPSNNQSTSSSGSESNDGADDKTDHDSGLEGFLMKKLRKIFISYGLGLFISSIVIILVASAVMQPFEAVADFFKGIFSSIAAFFNPSLQDLENKYYEKLDSVQNKIKKDYNICIDVNLITATLTVNKNLSDMLEDNLKEDQKDTSENYGEPESEDSSEEKNSVRKMTKQVKLLAYMQLTRQKYSFDKSIKNDTGNYCSDSETITTVNESNSSNFDTSFFEWLAGDLPLDSSTPEKIALNDEEFLFDFLAKQVDKEKNYAYYLYSPPFAEDGTCSDDYAKGKLPSDVVSLSIGNYETREDSVYYWNLVNSFIPDYYKEYLPDKNDPSYLDEVKKIADDIYLLYDQTGPSQTCSTDVAYTGPSALCPNGITIDGVGTIDFEEYVAGVVSREAYTSEGEEALKAQAVAARTYALNRTNYCQKSIANSTGAQTFTRDINDNARKATNATSGQILVSNGQIFSSMYDSFCYDDKDCPDAKQNSDGTYSVTYTKEPLGEKHVIVLSDSAQYKRLTHGQGHAHGMSQLLSYQMAKEGKTYDEILKYFYSEGVEIKTVTSFGGGSSPVPGGSTNQKLAALFPGGLPTSEAEMKKYLVTVSVPIVDINGNRTNKKVTLHKDLASDFVKIMTEIADAEFPVYYIACQSWRGMAGNADKISHHSYGVACDINPNENYMIKNGKVISGKLYQPGVNPYSMPANGVAVTAFKKFGWLWGGDWSSSKDYMHFSYTGY